MYLSQILKQIRMGLTVWMINCIASLASSIIYVQVFLLKISIS